MILASFLMCIQHFFVSSEAFVPMSYVFLANHERLHDEPAWNGFILDRISVLS